MAFRVAHEFLMVGKDSSGFTKNYYYEWDDGLGGNVAHLFLNFQLDSTEIPGSEVGDLVFDLFKNYFFHDLSRPAGDRFEDTLKEVNAAIRKKEEELGLKFMPNIHVVMGAVSDNQLYLSQHGDAEAYLIRRKYVSVLTDDLSDVKSHEELFQNIASGALSTGDYVLFCSARLLRYITKPDLGRLLSPGVSLEVALDAINDAVSIELMDRMSILGIQVGEEEVPVIEAAPLGGGQGGRGDGMESMQEEEMNFFGKGAKSLRSASALLGQSLKLRFGKLMPTLSRDKTPVEAEPSPHVTRAFEAPDMPIPDASAASVEPSSDLTALLHEWKTLKRDKILMILVAVVLVLLVGIYLVRLQGKKQHLVEELEGKLATVEINLNTARTTGSYDKESATALLDESEEIALDVLNSGYLRGKASEYLKEIDVQRDRLDNVQRLENPTVYADFTTANPTMNALGILPLGAALHVFEYNKLYELLLSQIQAPKTIDANEVVVDGAYFEDRDSLVFLTKSNRVIEYKDGQFSFLDTEDGSWRSGSQIAVYNNRIYLLDSAQGQIWRYPAGREGFGGGNGYLTQAGLDVKGARSLAIDGALYVLTAEGVIRKFVSGEEDTEFDIKKAPTTDLSGATVIYTEFEMFQLFLLDAAGNRVLVFNKDQRSGDLVYSTQYIFENTDELRDIYVDKEDSKLYVLGKSKVYEVGY